MTFEDANAIADALRLAYNMPVFVLMPGDEILGGDNQSVTIYHAVSGAIETHSL